VKLFDCWFRDGRAKGAPQLRTGRSEKSTISAADMAATVDDELPPLIMPHLKCDQASLDVLYPSLSVAEAVDADDPLDDESDPLLLEGQRRAQALVDTCREQGRRRKLVETEEEVAAAISESRTLTYLKHELHVVAEPSPAKPGSGARNVRVHPASKALGRGPMSPLVTLGSMSSLFAARPNGSENDSARPELRAPLRGLRLGLRQL